MNKKQKKMLTRIIIAAVMIIALNLIQITGIAQLLLYLATYLIIGYDILKKAGKGIINRQVFDENFLMAVATVGAFALAIYSGSGDYNEAIAVMLFYQTGELFQSYAVGKSRKNISALMDIRPDYANIEINGKLEKVDPDEVGVDSTIVVQPGEKVPLDGIVIEGSSSLNTSALTGESLPRDVKQGDEIISGCINMTGVLKIQTTKEFGESTVSKILELVENSSSRKSKSENFISKFAKVYTPAVCYGALALALLPPLVQMLFLGQTAQWGVWIYRALTFLVISCPCALVISIPLSFFAGIGGASKEGVLIKGSNYMETLSKTKYVVFDKTGTLTKGVFEVTAIHHNEMDEKKLLEYAALAECASSHPISKSLQKAYGQEIERNRVHDIQETSGHGVVAKVDGHEVAVGNSKLMKKLGVEYKKYLLPADATQEQVLAVIDEVNKDDSIHGVLLFRPLPKHLNQDEIEQALDPAKDVDCMTNGSMAGVFTGKDLGYPPCTPQACMEILDHYGIDCTGKKAVVVGRSLVVGKPAAMMLIKKNATVTVCHTRTVDMPSVVKEADIVIVAAGRAGVVDDSYVRAGQVIIDVGINVNAEGKLCGDVAYDKVEPIVDAITPVPGGVGSVTTSVLIGHVVDAAEKAAARR